MVEVDHGADDNTEYDDNIDLDQDDNVQHREKQLLLTQLPALVSFTGSFNFF